MIQFKDFKREIKEKGGFFFNPTYENISETILRLNYWVESNKFRIINIETLLIPEMKRKPDQSADEPFYKTQYGNAHSSKWTQIFRLWYDDLDTPSPPT